MDPSVAPSLFHSIYQNSFVWTAPFLFFHPKWDTYEGLVSSQLNNKLWFQITSSPSNCCERPDKLSAPSMSYCGESQAPPQLVWREPVTAWRKITIRLTNIISFAMAVYQVQFFISEEFLHAVCTYATRWWVISRHPLTTRLEITKPGPLELHPSNFAQI